MSIRYGGLKDENSTFYYKIIVQIPNNAIFLISTLERTLKIHILLDKNVSKMANTHTHTYTHTHEMDLSAPPHCGSAAQRCPVSGEGTFGRDLGKRAGTFGILAKNTKSDHDPPLLSDLYPYNFWQLPILYLIPPPMTPRALRF